MERKIGELKVITKENGILTPHNYSAMLNGGHDFANYIYPNYPDNSSTSGFNVTTNGSVLTIGKGLAKVGGVIVENVNAQKVDINSSTIGFGYKNTIYIAIKNVGSTAQLVVCDSKPNPIATDENTIGNYDYGTRYFVIAMFKNANLRLEKIPNETLQGATTNQTTISSVKFRESGDLTQNKTYWLDVKDYDLVCICHYDNEHYINWYTILDMRQMPLLETTIPVSHRFFSKNQGDIIHCMARFHIQKSGNQFGFRYTDWRVEKNGIYFSHDSYTPAFIYGLKIVQKQN